MELPDMIRKYRQMQQDAETFKASGSLARAWEMVVADLEQVTVPGMGTRYLSCQEVADALGLKRKTIAAWCREGRFPGAVKSGEKDGGVWLIPAEAAYRVVGQRGKPKISLLWRHDEQEKAS